MDEAEWLISTHAYNMLSCVYTANSPLSPPSGQPISSDRKVRLFACSCAQSVATRVGFTAGQGMIDMAEKVAEGTAVPGEREATLHRFETAVRENPDLADNLYLSALFTLCADPASAAHQSVGCAFEYERRVLNSTRPKVYANLLRCILGNPFRPVTLDPAWRTSTVVALAKGIYDDRAFDRLPVLADALQDAGCENDDILNHCRGDGPHARGCWVVDLVLGKE